MAKTHWKKLYNPQYLGAYSLDDGGGSYKDIIATIQKVCVEPVTGPDGKKEDCVVMYIVGNKPMVLNATNQKMLEKVLKTPYIEDWAGKSVQIGVESVRAFGDVTDALRIRKFLPKAASSPKCADCSKEITAAGQMNAAQVEAYTRKTFGASLCADCAKKRQEAAKVEQSEAEQERQLTPEEVEAMKGEVERDSTVAANENGEVVE